MSVQFDSNYPTVTVTLTFPAPIGAVDVTEYLIEGDTFNGRARETDRYDASATFVLDNWDGRFTPANLSGPYVSGGVSFVRPRVQVDVTNVWSATSYDTWTGEVTNWQDEWPDEGLDSITTITCAGMYSRIAAWNGSAVAAVGEGEFGGDRVDRILTAAGYAGGLTAAPGLVALAATTLEGNGISQILDVVDAESGAFWIEPDGTAQFEDRASLVLNSRSNTSQVTFSAGSVFFRNAKPISPDDRIFNTIVMSGASGVDQVATDATSESLFGPRTYARTNLPALEDTDVLAAAEFNLARLKDPQYGIAELTIDPAQSPTLMWPHALGRRIRDRVTITGAVLRSGVTVTNDAFIEGIRHRFSQNTWETTFSFSDATAWNGFSASVWDTGVWDTAEWFY